MLKVGLVGCGGMGNQHAQCYFALKDEVEIVAVADLCEEKAKKIADECGAKVYHTAQELIKTEKIDIVDICLPTYLHTKHAVQAMESGINVFCEKPVCLNEEEAQLLLETKKKTGVFVQVGQVIRFWDEYRYLKNAMETKEFGELISAQFFRLSPNPIWGWENWFNDYEKSGTMALDLHVHDVDYIRYLMNCEPDEIISRATRNKDGVLQQINTIYTFGNAVITSEGCWDYPDKYPFSMTFRAKFEKASMTFTDKLIVYPVSGDPFVPDIKKDFESKSTAGINVSDLGAYYNEIKYFIDMVNKKVTKEIAPLEEAVNSIRLVWKEIEIAGGKKI